MSRIKRMSLALVLALIMVMALAGTALAFNPPDNAPSGVGADLLCAPDTFPAAGIGVGLQGGGGPWNATDAGPNANQATGFGLDGGPPIDGNFVDETNECFIPEV